MKTFAIAAAAAAVLALGACAVEPAAEVAFSPQPVPPPILVNPLPGHYGPFGYAILVDAPVEQLPD